MPLFAVAFTSNGQAYQIKGLKTRANIVCDGQQYKIVTTANTVKSALEESLCGYRENDIVSPAPDTLLHGDTVNVTVKKAMPVTIADGIKTKITGSAYKNKYDVLKQLNIKIYPEDQVTSELIVSDFHINGLGQKITIKRAPIVNLDVDGKTTQVRTQKKTVSEMLAEKGIQAGPKDEINPSGDYPIYNGMKVSIVRVSEATINEDEVLPFQTITKSDSNLYTGQSKVESQGENGLKKRTFKAVYRNGAVVSKTLLSEQVVKEVKNKVIVNGSRPYAAGDLWPLMVAAGSEWGIDPGKLYRVAQCESGANPANNRNPIYKGLFQYHPGTWASASTSYPGGRFRGASIFDPTAQVFVTAWKARVSGWGAWPVCGRR